MRPCSGPRRGRVSGAARPVRERIISDEFTLSEPSTRAGAVEALRRAFEAAALPSAALDARLLVAAAAGIGTVDLLAAPDSLLRPEVRARIVDHGRRRLTSEPVARILGQAEFWSLPFRLAPTTLVPRPDTETVVEAALARVPDPQAELSVLDLGTGSGCILVALLSELPRAVGIGVDRSLEALVVARGNARQNGVGERASFVAADWAAPLREPVDLIVANPPYIATGALAELDADVRHHDPLLALDGGPDGLVSLRRVLSDAARLLRPGGFAAVEIGFDQAESAAALAGGAGLTVDEVRADLAGRPRAIVVRRR